MFQIECEVDHGCASGYVVDATEVNIRNYLEQHTDLAEAIALKLEQRKERVALLRNIHVDEEHRNQGIGTELVLDFINKAESAGATCYIAICDAGETQKDGFELEAWYNNLGFVRIAKTGSGPLMAMPEALVEDFSHHFGESESP